MELRPVLYKKAYELKIAKAIYKWFYNSFFKGCFEIINKKGFIDNSNNIIIEAIRSGLIYYEDGAFYSKNNRFSNSIAKELERLGAKYSKYRKGYLINIKKLDMQIVWAIETVKARSGYVAKAIQSYLTTQLSNIDDLLKNLVIKTAVNEIMLDLQKRTFKTLEEKKIPVIYPKLTDFTSNEIARKYTDNLDYWIKNWAETDIPKMREVVGQMAIEGQSTKTIANYIQKEFDVSSKSKALFLARNETGLATTSYLEAKYRQEGFERFKWHTILDGRERKLHKELNGQVFRFDDPPIIYEYKGIQQRGLPKETFNCRCSFSPVFDKDFLLNRRKKK